MNKPIYEPFPMFGWVIVLILCLLVVVMVFNLGISCGVSSERQSALYANAAHYEMVDKGPAVEFKWGPKP